MLVQFQHFIDERDHAIVAGFVIRVIEVGGVDRKFPDNGRADMIPTFCKRTGAGDNKPAQRRVQNP